jgi:hypothetical protein
MAQLVSKQEMECDKTKRTLPSCLESCGAGRSMRVSGSTELEEADVDEEALPVLAVSGKPGPSSNARRSANTLSACEATCSVMRCSLTR